MVWTWLIQLRTHRLTLIVERLMIAWLSGLLLTVKTLP